MSRGLNSISRRTRSNWEAFYKSRHDEIIKNKKPHQDDAPLEHHHHLDSINIQDSDADDDDDYKLKVCKQAGKKIWTRKAGRQDVDSISIEDSDDDDDDDYELKVVGKKRGTRTVERPHVDSISSSQDSDGGDYKVRVCKQAGKIQKTKGKGRGKAGKKRKAEAGSQVDLMINMLVDSIWNKDDNENAQEEYIEEDAAPCTLPLKFQFDQDDLSPKTDHREIDIDIDIDSLFRDLELGLWESQTPHPPMSYDDDDECNICEGNDESPAARCGRGEHDLVLDEEIGILCKYCLSVLLEIKHVLPPFYVEPRERRGVKHDLQEAEHSVMNELRFEGSNGGDLDSSNHSQGGTVLDLIPERDRKSLYPHQLEGLEFMWRNIAGDTHINNLKRLPPNGGRGCIISHAPGTGKTRLSIVFLQTFLKLYPNSRPIIIAPRGMLLTWEQELLKWKVGIKFHNLNETKLSTEEIEFANGLVDQTHEKSKDYSRFVKLCSWMKGGSVLGIGYRMFEELAGEHGKKRGNTDRFKKILLEAPGLLVLDEGHTPRNSQSLMWKALMKTTTKRRVILSGTPFQNNFTELYNTLCLVNPTFSQTTSKTPGRKPNAARDEWAYVTNSICKSSTTGGENDGLKKLRLMIKPFVHIHKGGILEKTLPGMRDCMIVLKPTDLQRKLVHKSGQANDKFLEQAYLASLISVHPSLVANKPEFSDERRKLKSLEWDPNAGAKTRFIVKLIELACRLEEKVLIFSEFIDPLQHIKKLIKQHFGWSGGREVMYMGGDVGINQRQLLMNSFNDKRSEAKVMLASQRACAEGINLVGASRVVLLDVAWNPAVERQAICRAYRLGQDKIVYVYHLVTLMELNKYAKQAHKDRISELLFTHHPHQRGGAGAGAGGIKTPAPPPPQDQVLEAMLGHGIFDRIIHQPKESDFINTFAFLD